MSNLTNLVWQTSAMFEQSIPDVVGVAPTWLLKSYNACVKAACVTMF